MPALFRTISPLNPFNPSPIPRYRSASTSAQPKPNMLPYRDTNNSTIGYATASHLGEPIHASSPYDSDFEPLIAGPGSALDEESTMRFTATGRPMPAYRHSGLMSLAGDMQSLPQLLPKRYTDDSIIPAIVVDVIPSQRTLEEEERKRGRRGSFMKKLKGEPKKDEGKGLTKVVYMPRRDYLKWFARDLEGNYIGTEPYKKWEEEELDEAFKQYKPVVEKKKGYSPPF